MIPSPLFSMLKHFKTDRLLKYVKQSSRMTPRTYTLCICCRAAVMAVSELLNILWRYDKDLSNRGIDSPNVLSLDCIMSETLPMNMIPNATRCLTITYLEFGEAFGDQISGAMQLFYWRHLFVVQRERREFPAPHQITVGS